MESTIHFLANIYKFFKIQPSKMQARIAPRQV